MASQDTGVKVADQRGSVPEASSTPSFKPDFNVTAICAQILSNIMIVVTMNIGLTGDGDTYPDRLGPIPIIMTSNEANQTRAAVVCWARGQYNLGVHGFLQVSLAASQSEALLSLYEESKNLVTCTKAHFVPKDRLYV